jgi:hypothetical protein
MAQITRIKRIVIRVFRAIRGLFSYCQPFASLRAAKDVNLGDYKEEPRMTPIRADQYERGDRPIRAFPRNLRFDLLTADNRENRDLAFFSVSSVCSCLHSSFRLRVSSVFDLWLYFIPLRPCRT